jgi:hypothetical protein
MTVYPELTDAENGEILRARQSGFSAMYPSFPNAEAQARNTLAGAREWLSSLGPQEEKGR